MFYLQGVTFPAMMAMWARWAPPLERSRLMTLSGCGGNFGAFVALPLTGYICQTLGWPAVFYLCGELGETRAHTYSYRSWHTLVCHWEDARPMHAATMVSRRCTIKILNIPPRRLIQTLSPLDSYLSLSFNYLIHNCTTTYTCT